MASHQDMVGPAITRKLQAEGFTYLIIKTHKEFDLTDQQAVKYFLKKKSPSISFWLLLWLAALKQMMTIRQLVYI